MFRSLLRAAAPVLLIIAAPLAAQSSTAPVTPADLMRHISVLASDAYQGRAPGSEGERLTIAYIADQFRARGLEPAGESGSWFQPVRLAERRPARFAARWTTRGAAVDIAPGDMVLMGRDAQESIANAPIVFAGHGARLPARGIDQLAGANIRGAVVLILLEGPDVPGFPSLGERIQAVSEAGAAAVIAIVGDDIDWADIAPTIARGTTRLDSTPVPRIVGAMPMAVAERLVLRGGIDMAHLLNDQPGSSFRAVALPATFTMDVTTQVTRYTSNNVVGRVRGSGGSGESLLLLAHWDNFGLCRPQSAPDRICNGAVDNASGVASLIEIAGRLVGRPRPVRDLLFLATTSEETGLLGAEYFAAHPAVPLDRIVAAVNLDKVAIAPAGEPVAVIGRGVPALDAAIDATVAAMGRRLDNDDEAAPLTQQQDGWALARFGVPAVMVSGAFSNMALFNAYVGGRYRTPGDQADSRLVLSGAAEDADLIVALARRLADPSRYQRAQRASE